MMSKYQQQVGIFVKYHFSIHNNLNIFIHLSKQKKSVLRFGPPSTKEKIFCKHPNQKVIFYRKEYSRQVRIKIIWSLITSQGA